MSKSMEITRCPCKQVKACDRKTFTIFYCMLSLDLHNRYVNIALKLTLANSHLTKAKLIISLQCEYTGEYSRKEL